MEEEKIIKSVYILIANIHPNSPDKEIQLGHEKVSQIYQDR